MGRGSGYMDTKRLIIDLAKCVGCFNCLAACKDEFADNSWLPYTDRQKKHDQKWIDVQRHERGAAPYTEVCYVPRLCNHCENAECEKAFPDAVKRREDGIVLLDPDMAKGNKALADACPYGMISWNDELETTQKCTMCAHLLDGGWKEPRCVQACPLRAISVVSCGDEEFAAMAAVQELAPLRSVAEAQEAAQLNSMVAEKGVAPAPGKAAGRAASREFAALIPEESRPRVLYKNLHKYTDCFIAGALAYEADGVEHAASGALVKLNRGGEILFSVETDFFGEFRIDRIPPNSGSYELSFYLDGFDPAELRVSVAGGSVCLDVIKLEKR